VVAWSGFGIDRIVVTTTKVPDEQALRAQIWNTPEDRAALAIYADWLLQHGDATRGEYMQLSLLAKPTPAQTRRRDALRNKHRGAWLGAARPFVYTWEESETSPGFVAEVKCSTKKLAAGFEQIRALGPRLVVAINPTASASDRAVLASLPLGTLYGLALSDADVFWLKDRAVRQLLPALAGLRGLRLAVWDGDGRGSFSLDTWRALLDAVPTLEAIDFAAEESSSDSYIEALLAHPIAPRLRRLAFGHGKHLLRKIRKACPRATVTFW
jgi:uncharacterized protein (TIGR02996 family)